MCSEKQDTKVCTICGVEKPKTVEFFYNKTKDGRTYWNPRCRPCDRKYVREYKLMKKYGLTSKEVEDMLVKQQNRCFICDMKFTKVERGKRMFNIPYVDHCHTTGQVRGILCGNCNTGLGHFKDSPMLLRRAIDYLCEEIV